MTSGTIVINKLKKPSMIIAKDSKNFVKYMIDIKKYFLHSEKKKIAGDEISLFIP